MLLVYLNIGFLKFLLQEWFRETYSKLMLYMYVRLEEALQNEAVGMNFSVDSQYQFQATSKVRWM